MGGHDPYSSSKGAAEIAIGAYRRSFFKRGARVASVRAGNVLGGGDWAADRLIPDIVRAMLAGKQPVIRFPNSVRPWQHVMDALSGYMLLAQRLLAGGEDFADGWNFGPSEEEARSVAWIVEKMLALYGAGGWRLSADPQPHEATLLKLDCSKSRAALGWRPRLDLQTALAKVVEWHSQVAAGADARAVTMAQLDQFSAAAGATSGHVEWA
jgi:CDP-glucose 4,6-dehydratase